MHQVNKYVRRMYPDEVLYTIGEAGREVGRSPQTLRRWEASGGPGASRTISMGENEVRLYTIKDITDLREFADTQRPGRKAGGA